MLKKFWTSWEHPAVTLFTMDARLAFEHVPTEHSPVSHVLAIAGTSSFPEIAIEMNAPVFKHWASGANSNSLRAVVHDDDNESKTLTV